jgi:hypothetical protein
MRPSVLLLGLVFVCLCGPSRAQENLVKNPGFEGAATTNGLPGGGWWLYEARGTTEVTRDVAVSHSGKFSVRLRAKKEAKSVLVSHGFEVAPGDEIQFESWVRPQDVPSQLKTTFAGLAFRRADGTVFERAYFPVQLTNGSWSRIAGTTQTPEAASSAEIHLGYTNAPGTLWFDDVAAVITSPLSFSLVEGAKSWPGRQEISAQVVSRQKTQFQGSISFVSGRQSNSVPVLFAAGTSRQFKLPITLNGIGAHEYRLSLFDAAGTPVRVLRGKFQTTAPFVLYPACPCYHLLNEGSGETRLDARINLDPAQRAGLRLEVAVVESTGKEVQTTSADASKGDTVGLSVQVPVQKTADFQMNARLLNATGNELAKSSTDVHIRPRADSQVTTGRDGYLRVEGRPYFPIGLYNCGRFEEMAKAGFNCTHEYGIVTGEANDAINPNENHVKQILDNSWKNGMRLMLELPRKAIEKAQWQQIRRRIETFRHHPGLLCWGSEERVARGTAPLKNIETLYRIVHELDPDHPLVLGDTKDVIQKFEKDRSDFFPDSCMDAGIWWWYPIPLKEPDGNGLDGPGTGGLLEPPSWLVTTVSKKPLWIAIQSYQKPSKDARFPTPQEYRWR